MKLGMLIPEFPTQTHVFFWREIEALRSLGVDVDILSTRRPAEACPHEFAKLATQQTHYVYPPSKRSVLLSGFHPMKVAKALEYILSLSEPAKRKARALGYLACAADLVHHAKKQGLDHIHTHSCADAAHVVAMARILGGPPFSLHLHGDLPVYGKDHRQKMAEATFVAAAAKPMERQLVQDAGVPQERAVTLWMGVDTSRFKPRVLGPARSGPMHLVSVGRLNLCKGHRFALQAMRKALDEGADIRYTIAGSGPDEAEIRAAVAEGNFGDRVKLVGSLGESGVLELLLSADAFVLSSVGLGEASPVAVMESMAAGVPVISSIIGGTPDMITDGVDGLLVEQQDVAGLTRAMKRLAQDEPFRRKLADGARKRALEQFDSKSTARRLLATIEQAAQRSRQAA